MSSRTWIQVSMTLPPPLQELLTGQLAAIGFSGFHQEETVLHCIAERRRWTARFRRQLQDTLARLKKEFPSADPVYSVSILREQNWNAQWERSIGIIEATSRIIIKPSWRKLRKRDAGKVVLHIDPQMSFGTGHHETTRLCLSMLEQFVKDHTKVLDVGSGTGILSIAAVKLGASAAVGIDNDPWALMNARENVVRNRVRRSVRIRRATGNRLPKGTFGVIVSNIDLATNLSMLRSMAGKLDQHGTVILSGFLAADLRMLLDNLRRTNLLPLEIIEENEWVAVALVKADATQRH